MNVHFWRRTTASPAGDRTGEATEHPHQRLRAPMFLALVAFGVGPVLMIALASASASRSSMATRRVELFEAMVRNRAATIDLFLESKMRQLELLAAAMPVAELRRPGVVAALCTEMQREHGGIVDLGVIDSDGRHLAYAGPYDLLGKNYKGQPWFDRVLVLGRYQSDLFMGYRQFPHVIMAVRKREGDGTYLLRATLDIEELDALLRGGSLESGAELFILNRSGEYQARYDPSHRPLEKTALVIPPHSGVRVQEVSRGGQREMMATAWLTGSSWVLVARQAAPPSLGAVSRDSPVFWAAVFCLLVVPLAALPLARYGDRRVRALEEERAGLYESVAQSEKLAAIGRLATTTAHEINNPLAIIDAQVGLLIDMLNDATNRPDSEDVQDRLKKISAQVQRGKTVTHRLLGFSRRVGPLIEPVDVIAALDETLSFLEKDAEVSRIRVAKEYAPGIPLVRSNIGQMQQVFLNVVSNAIDAVGHDGEVSLSVRCGRGGVEVEVADSGPGIPESDLERVFEPFYSTKARDSRHCGLGLSICREIMRTLGGRITASSGSGGGAVFTMWFPVRHDGR
jgi:two-component system NtrC family sensor kinase